jgi:hypothetical protein
MFGEDAARSHALAKMNAYQTQVGLLLRLNQELSTVQGELFDDLAARPDAFWFDDSPRDRLAAWVEGTSLALEDRGLPQLSFRESLRQLLLGDVVKRVASDHDEIQVTARSARRAHMRVIEQLAAAFAAMPGGTSENGGVAEDPESPLDEADVEQLFQDLLHSHHSS